MTEGTQTKSSRRSAPVGAVAIGRNEGERLLACLRSLRGQLSTVVYVDSGSTDGSAAAAEDLGATVISLDMDRPFTAARARNTGLEALMRIAPETELVQFIDGDCSLDPHWIETGRKALREDNALAVVCGRRRERFPEASLWNRLIDMEWDTPVGPARACGGDALMRVAPVRAEGGFNPGLIAGEEPELCVRLRAAGWRIARLDAEMTLHDAAMTRFSQWWRRTRRAGHAYAEGAAIHGAPPERHNIAETRRAVLWGIGLPAAALVGTVAVSPWALAILLAFPAQVLRLTLRGEPATRAFFLVLGRFPEAQGACDFWIRSLRGGQARLIEYK